METLGHHQGTGEKGIFQYRRTADRIEVTTSASTTQVPNATYFITNHEWALLLIALTVRGKAIMRLSPGAAGQPDLASIFAGALISPTTGLVVPPTDTTWTWAGPVAMHSYVASIMEHEGSLDLAHGTGAGIFIPLENG